MPSMNAPETSDATLVIRMFGPMQALVGGQPLPRMRSRKGLWLLALLALRHARPVEREWLAGTLWPDVEPSQAFANLRPILSELRNGLGNQSERLQSPNRHTLTLDLTGTDADLLRFDSAIAGGQITALREAVELYGGPLLEGCAEEWVFQERQLRERQCVQALQRLGEAALVEADYAGAIAYFQKAVMLAPLEEAARRGWMEALAHNGDRNAALQVYREFVALLRDDPNAVPDTRTTALYARLRAEARQPGGTALSVTPPVATVRRVTGYLPHPLTELVGREDERAEVAERLGRSRLVTLTGMGGIGKTRLALAVARDVARDYADGVWLIALDALSEGGGIVPQIASVLGIRAEPGSSLLDSVTAHLRDRQLLLLLDNCEHLREACAQLAAHLLEQCGRLCILATSREALEIAGEVAWATPLLPFPDPTHLPEKQATLLRVLLSYESVQLFVERAQAAQKTFALTGANAHAVAQICAGLEGIPLALELAAARVKAMTVEQIAVRLNAHSGQLLAVNRTAHARQQTMRATLDWSHALLNERERLLLCRLAVFSGGWTLEAAEHICSLAPIGEEQVLDLLTSLVDKSLVVFEARETGARYRLLEVVRQYAWERLQACGEEEILRSRHRDWFLKMAEAAVPYLRGSDQARWLQRLDTEYDNFRAALAWSATEAQDGELELRLAAALGRFWYMRGKDTEGRRYLDHALQRRQAQSPTLWRAAALNLAGSLAYDQADYAAARASFEESLSLGRQLEDRQSVGISLSNLGNIALANGEHGSARTLYEESLALKRAIGDRAGVALTLSNMGVAARQQGDYVAARTLFEESLEIAKELSDQLGMARAFLNMGNVARHQED